MPLVTSSAQRRVVGVPADELSKATVASAVAASAAAPRTSIAPESSRAGVRSAPAREGSGGALLWWQGHVAHAPATRPASAQAYAAAPWMALRDIMARRRCAGQERSAKRRRGAQGVSNGYRHGGAAWPSRWQRQRGARSDLFLVVVFFHTRIRIHSEDWLFV